MKEPHMIGFSLCDYVGGPIDPLTPGFPCQIFGRDNTHLMLAQFCPKMYNVSDFFIIELK